MQCPECRECVSSVQAQFFLNGQEIWRLDTSSGEVHADEDRRSAAEISARIGTVTVQQQTQTTEHSSLAQHVPEQGQQATSPHPLAPLLRLQPEDAHHSSHDVHMPATTAYAVENAPPPHITPAIRMDDAPELSIARTILGTETAYLQNLQTNPALLSPQFFPSGQEVWRGEVLSGGEQRTEGGGGRISPELQYSMLKSNMALRVLYFLSSYFLGVMLVGHSGDGGGGNTVFVSSSSLSLSATSV
jgi:hypothetical protein